MVIDQLSTIKSDPKLLDALKAAQRKMTAHELIEQRVSYVYGTLGQDSNITKEQIRKVVQEKIGILIPAA